MSEKKIEEFLEEAAVKVTPAVRFKAELERQLKDAHKPKERFVMFKNKNLVSTLGLIGAIAILLLALNWAFRSLAPKTIPGAGNTPLPTRPQESLPTPLPATPNAESYDFRGTKLYLAQPLPESPANANVYLLNKDQPATLDEARALAQRFGIQSDAYTASGQIPNTTDYVFTNGKQMLSVHSNFYFNYTSDIVRNNNNFGGSQNSNAETIIADFLKSHGFDFSFKIEGDELRGGYVVQPLSPDGYPMQYEFYSSPIMWLTLDDNGQVLSMDASLMDYDSTPVGTFGIISAEDAFQKMLDDTIPAGKIESGHSASKPIKEWRRIYPANEMISIYGYASSISALDSSKPAFVQIDGYTATGNLNGMDALKPNTYVQATGQFIIENEIQKFKVESWKVSKELEDGLTGTLHRDGAKVILSTADQGEYTLVPDVPADLPMPFENAFVIGVKIGNTFDWKLIDDRMTAGGGGGGGGGLGFYQLNLSGTPVPFPTSQSASQLGGGGGGGGGGGNSEQTYTIKAGDTLSKIASEFGISIDSLAQANGISDPGTIYIGQKLIIPSATSASQQHQLLTGTQKVTQINNQTVILFTVKDGKTYAQGDPNGNLDNAVLIGREGDKVSLEAVIASDQTFDGYPVLLVSAGGLAGQGGGGGGGPIENLPPTPDISNTPTALENYTPPSLAIEKVELVYFVSNPLYQANDPSASRRSPYIQPAWHFSGHYSNGDSYDILIQALKQEFLSPEIAPYIQGG